jgi:predicted cupin superfamily sugar epimerase
MTSSLTPSATGACAQDIIRKLDLMPHPEGGYFRRTYRNVRGPQDRGYASAILYLLDSREFALWHRFDADELWLWHAGAPLTMEQGMDKTASKTVTIGPNVLSGEKPQVLVPTGMWQRVRSHGDWTLVSCVVSPGFLLENLELDGAPAGAAKR